MSAASTIVEPFISVLYNDDCNSGTIDKLKSAVENQKLRMSPSQYSDFLMQSASIASELVTSEHRDSRSKLVGLSVLDCLLDVSDESSAGRKVWIADICRRILETDRLYLEQNADVLRSSAACIGHLARVANTQEREFIQNFYNACVVKWLSDLRSENHRFAAVVSLRQMASNWPGLVYSTRKVFFSSIWDVLFDKVILIREEAAKALESVLVLFHQRGVSGSFEEFLRLAVRQMEIGFQNSSTSTIIVEKVHGSMLILESIFNAIPPNEFLNGMRKEFPAFIWGVLRRRDMKESYIKIKVIEMIPKLASTSSVHFRQENKFTAPDNFLTISSVHLLSILKLQNEYRQKAYISLGKLFLAMSATLRDKENLLRSALLVIKSGFNEPFCIEALQCLAMVVKISPYMRHCVDDDVVQLTFCGGLTPQLIDCLKVFVKHAPDIRTLVQKRLLNNITSILQQYSVSIDDCSPTILMTSSSSSHVNPLLKASLRKASQSSSMLARMTGAIRGASHNIIDSIPEGSVDKEELILALQVLASFDFLPKRREPSEAAKLLSVVREGAARFLDDCHVTVRGTAAETCAIVLDKVVDVLSGPADRHVILQVVDRLLVLAVGDSDADIRVRVLQAFSPSLDRIVAESETVQCVIEALNDESINVRAAAMTVLARVAHYDSLHVMPLMHLSLSELIRQLQTSKNAIIRKESVQVLRAMVRGISNLIIPYAQQVLEPLLGLLDDDSADVVGSAIATVGDLAVVAPVYVAQHIEGLFSRILEAMSDQSSVSKQTIATVTLGKMISSLCITSENYISHPRLFEIIVEIIQNTDPNTLELRLQAMKTAGYLGAVSDEQLVFADLSTTQSTDLSDKNLVVANKAVKQQNEEQDSAPTFYDLTEDAMSIDLYYLYIVMRALVTILRDSALTAHHDTAAGIGMKIIKALKMQSLPQLDVFVEGLIHRLYNSKDDNLLEQNLLVHVVSVINIFGRNAQKHVKTFVKVVCNHIDTYLQNSMEIIEALFNTLPAQDFSVVLREVLPFMTQILIDEVEGNALVGEASKPSSHENIKHLLNISSHARPSEKKAMAKSSVVMKTLAKLSACLSEYRLDVIAVILQVMEQSTAMTAVRCASLSLVMQLVRESSDIKDFASRIVHPILRLMSSTEIALQSAALTALSLLICTLGMAYIPFIIPARRVIQRLPMRLPQLEEYERLLLRLLQQRPLPTAPASALDVIIPYESSRSKTTSAPAADEAADASDINLQALEDAWTLSGRATASDLQEWLRRMSLEFVKQSPSVIIRPCAGLALVYEPLAAQLLNASFMSLWGHLTADSTEADVVNDIALINSLEQAFQMPQLPGKIRHTLLNVAEFMEMRDRRLPLDIKILAHQAEKANMLAISLRYRELEFLSPNMLPSTNCIEALITINNQLGLRESASGILQHVRTHYKHVSIKPLWLEKLYRWADAKETYQQQLLDLEARDGNLLVTSGANSNTKLQENWILCELGMLRCLYALGEYDELSSKARNLQDFMQKSISVHENYEVWVCELQQLGAVSAWKLGRWTEMESFVENQPLSRHHDNQLYKDGTFFQSILAIHRQEFNKAYSLINQLRENAAGTVASLLSDSFSRAHKAMTTMQIITELEEVLEYKKAIAKVKAFRETHSILGTSGFTLSSSGTPTHTSRVADNIGLQRVTLDAQNKKLALLDKWKRRWRKAPKSIEVYRDILAVRQLAIEPMEDLDTWLDLVSFCRKEQHALPLCRNLLTKLGAPLDTESNVITRSDTLDSGNGGSGVGNTPSSVPLTSDNYKFGQLSAHPKVLYAMHKYLWESNERARALSELDTLVGFLSHSQLDDDMHSLKVDCLLRRAEWTRILNENRLTDVLLNDVSIMVRTARDIAPDQYSVWHAWAVTNYYQLRLADAKETAEENAEAGATVLTPTYFTDDLPSTQFQSARQKRNRHGRGRSYSNVSEMLQVEKVDNVTPFVVESIRGFIRSISLGRDQPVAYLLQDTLRLLTLWFTYGSKTRVFACLDAELDSISAEEWLSVIPQLIARMHMKVNEISHLLRKVLSKVAVAHPQALVYPISVAVNNSDDGQQSLLAADVLRIISQNNAQLVSEAAVVSSELLRVAISPHEMWSEGLERAADMYMTYNNVDGMLEVLQGLNAAMGDWEVTDSPTLSSPTKRAQPTESSSVIDKETLKDVSFRHEYGSELHSAHEWLEQYERTRNLADLHQAWEVYHFVFKRIAVQLRSLKTVELSHVSPRLTDSKSLLLAVPGTYRPLREVVRIASFAKFVDVISSKQRPRKLTVYGSDGNEYRFLLKGHEDLRQDERVMQLFGLINACLENNPKTKRKGFKIVRYTVLPLSNNAGVIGWVENCDTLNQLIKRYREQRHLHLDAEMRLLKSKAPDFERLPLIHRIELFHEVQEETTGKDLAIMLWLNSKSSDAWVQRRANYTKSLAAMSMVGYILGLGDRHPSNLMLDRVSGRVVHIDFGDCFEVAMHREMFPETVPFRLTRMLVRSMEASGIEGTFRVSSETVMRILRENRDSVMAMLEAFVYDPLISWRLLAAPKETGRVDSPRDDKLSTDSVLQALSAISADSSGSGDHGLMGPRPTSDTLSMSVSKTMAQSQKARQISFRSDKSADEAPVQENLNSRALEIINRVQSKLTGRDFDGGEYLTVEQQVERLVLSATSPDNLCQLFAGWCPFW